MNELVAAPKTEVLDAPGLEFAQKAFITSDDRLLLVRKSDSDPHHPGRWDVPGGRLEVCGDLDLDQHICREVREEVGLKIEPGPPFYLWEWSMPAVSEASEHPVGQVRVVAVARICTPVTLNVTTDNQVHDDHISEVAWVPIHDLSEYELIPALKPVIQDFLRHHDL
jgi:8-oxo-dGTP diphosphatase